MKKGSPRILIVLQFLVFFILLYALFRLLGLDGSLLSFKEYFYCWILGLAFIAVVFTVNNGLESLFK